LFVLRCVSFALRDVGYGETIAMTGPVAAHAGSGRKDSLKEEGSLTALEDRSHAFLLRVEMEEGSGVKRWRGRVTHIEGNECRAIHSFDELKAFIEQFLGVVPVGSKKARITQWFRKLTRSRAKRR
jgi:hypothetical protein